MTQKQIAAELGVSQAVVSGWAKEGAPVQAGAAAVAAWRAANKRVHISASAPTAPPPPAADASAPGAGPSGGQALDLGQERALLAREQRMSIELRNAVLRGEYASIALLGEVLATASQAVADRFDHLPGQLRKACPDLPQSAIDQVMATIARARNEWVRSTLVLVTAKLSEAGDVDLDVIDADDGADLGLEGAA